MFLQKQKKDAADSHFGQQKRQRYQNQRTDKRDLQTRKFPDANPPRGKFKERQNRQNYRQCSEKIQNRFNRPNKSIHRVCF